MNMPKSRDIQAKIPLPQAIWNEFWLRYCEGVNSNENGEYLFAKEETFDEFLSLLYHEHTKRK